MCPRYSNRHVETAGGVLATIPIASARRTWSASDDRPSPPSRGIRISRLRRQRPSVPVTSMTGVGLNAAVYPHHTDWCAQAIELNGHWPSDEEWRQSAFFRAVCLPGTLKQGRMKPVQPSPRGGARHLHPPARGRTNRSRGAEIRPCKAMTGSLRPEMLIDEADLLGKALSIFRGSGEAAVRHCFEYVKLCLDTGSPQGTVQNDRV
jgi:hypothetical protein